MIPGLVRVSVFLSYPHPNGVYLLISTKIRHDKRAAPYRSGVLPVKRTVNN